MKELAPHYSLQQTEIIPMPVTEEEVHLRDHWRVVRKRSQLVLTIFLCPVLIVGAVLYVKTPIYTATATLLIERQAPQMLDIRALQVPEDESDVEYDYYQTQFELLKSRSLAADVIRAQGLEKDRRLTGPDKEASRAKSHTDEEGSLGVDSRLIDVYLRNLQIDQVPRTRLVKVSFSTSDPQLSARLANAHAHAYINQGLEFHAQASKEAQSYLDGELIELRERVEKSEAALNSYRRQNGILSLNNKENIVVESLTDLNNRATDAEAERIGLEAQAQLIQSRDYDSLPAVVNNTLIQTLKEQLAREEQHYASLSSQFTPRYWRVVQEEAEVNETKRRLKHEIQGVVQGIESAYLAAEAKEKELHTEIDKRKAAAFALNDAAVQYAILAREVNTNRQLYDSVLQRIKEIGVATEAHISNVSVIDKAVPPLSPASGKRLLDLAISALIGLSGGVGLAFVLEYFDNTLKTPQEVERYLRLPNLGTIPDFASIDQYDFLRRALPNGSAQLPQPVREELSFVHPSLATITEAYATLHTNILLSRAGEPPKTLMFTSSTQGEGKTMTVLNIAVMFSQMGARALVIDADLRHSSCHRLLGTPTGVGLTEVLVGQVDVHDVVRAVAKPLLYLLPAGSRPPNPLALLGSKKMQDILNLIREEYDYILIDSPPVMPVADAMLLSAMVDGVVLVVNSQKTPDHIVKESRSRLSYARAKMLGVVLNQVNMRNGDYAYYHRQYCSYHHHQEEVGDGTAGAAS
jgi:capsular exopolysaccharide synthesis family protein